MAEATLGATLGLSEPRIRVCFIRPTEDSASDSEEALLSVRSQTFSEWELIFCTSPSTLSAAWRSEPPSGRGEYLTWLDSRTRWEPSFLERMVAVLDADPGLQGVAADCLYMEENFRRPLLRFSDIFSPHQIPACAAVIRLRRGRPGPEAGRWAWIRSPLVRRAWSFTGGSVDDWAEVEAFSVGGKRQVRGAVSRTCRTAVRRFRLWLIRNHFADLDSLIWGLFGPPLARWRFLAVCGALGAAVGLAGYIFPQWRNPPWRGILVLYHAPSSPSPSGIPSLRTHRVLPHLRYAVAESPDRSLLSRRLARTAALEAGSAWSDYKYLLHMWKRPAWTPANGLLWGLAVGWILSLLGRLRQQME